MAAFRSRPGGDRLLGWRGWVLGLLAAWMVPVLLGVAILPLAGLAERLAGPPVPLAALWVGVWLMVMSMMFAALWLVQLGLAAWLLLRLGAGGWLSLLAAGAAAGASGMMAVPGMSPAVGAALGAINALVLWIVFSRIRPEIFTTR